MLPRSKYLRWSAYLLAFFLLIGSAVATIGYLKYTETTVYRQSFTSAAAVARIGEKTMTSSCREVKASVKVTEKAVILSFNGDTLSGIPVMLSDDGGLHVQFSDTLTIILYKVDPDGDGREALILAGPGEVLILSQTDACEDIAQIVDEIAG